eukprot:297332-Chlamydomonas_euryale.AAC.1
MRQASEAVGRRAPGLRGSGPICAWLPALQTHKHPARSRRHDYFCRCNCGWTASVAAAVQQRGRTGWAGGRWDWSPFGLIDQLQLSRGLLLGPGEPRRLAAELRCRA